MHLVVQLPLQFVDEDVLLGSLVGTSAPTPGVLPLRQLLFLLHGQIVQPPRPLARPGPDGVHLA